MKKLFDEIEINEVEDRLEFHTVKICNGKEEAK